MLFLHITTRIEGQKNDGLLGDKGGNGFPYLAFLDSDGNVLAKHNGNRTVDEFEKTGAKAKGLVDLKKKADGGDKGAKVDYALAMLELNAGGMALEAAKKSVADLGELSKEQKAKVDGLLATIETLAVVKTITRDAQTRIDAGKKFLEMKKAGRIPTTEESIQPFWIFIMDYAADQKDAATYEEALGVLREKFGSNPNAKKFFDERTKKLEELKAEKK